MANEKRLIYAEDAKRQLIALAVGHHSETLHIDMILNAILHHTPTVDAVEVVHGRWIKGKYPGEYICSHCGLEYCEADPEEKPYKYCPECGSKNE